MSDAARLLHAKSEHGYTSNPVQALHAEPEAVPADYQQAVTRNAKETARERDLAAWRPVRDRITQALDELGADALSRRIASDLRVIRRQLERIDRRLSA